jgi:ankyrin repeat protein
MFHHFKPATFLAALTLLLCGGYGIGCGSKAPPSTPLHDAAMTDDPAKVQAALGSSPGGVDALNADKESPLIVASRAGATNSAKVLLDAGANISFKDTYGYTPLHWAAYGGQLSTARLLIDRHADVNAVDLKMETPLMLAAAAYPEVVHLLVEKGANVNAFDGSHWTALEYAVKKNQRETVTFLLAHGAHANTQDSDYGWTPLLYAADYGYLEIGRELVDSGADVNVKAKDGLTALQEARKESHPDFAKFLESKGAH